MASKEGESEPRLEPLSIADKERIARKLLVMLCARQINALATYESCHVLAKSLEEDHEAVWQYLHGVLLPSVPK